MAQLEFMDNPISHLDAALTSTASMIKPDVTGPLREPTDDWTQFRGRSGVIVRRGERDEFDNPRLFGKLNF